MLVGTASASRGGVLRAQLKGSATLNFRYALDPL
jgi:hypothetical protein